MTSLPPLGAFHEELVIVEVRHYGGGYGDLPAHSNVVHGRDAEFAVYFGSLAEQGSMAEARAPQTAVRAAFGPDDRGTVMNFLGVDPDPAWVRAAFNPEAYERIRRMKQQLDLDNLFRINHNAFGELRRRGRHAETPARRGCGRASAAGLVTEGLLGGEEQGSREGGEGHQGGEDAARGAAEENE